MSGIRDWARYLLEWLQTIAVLVEMLAIVAAPLMIVATIIAINIVGGSAIVAYRSGVEEYAVASGGVIIRVSKALFYFMLTLESATLASIVVALLAIVHVLLWKKWLGG